MPLNKRQDDILLLYKTKFVCSAIVAYKTIKSLLSHICNMYSCSAKQSLFIAYLKRYEIWNLRNVITKMNILGIFGGKMRRLAMILVTY